MKYTNQRRHFLSRATGFSLAAIVVTGACFARAESIGIAPRPAEDELLLTSASELPPVGQGLAVTAYSSRPGAPYTVYLDFGGFTFTGNWGGVSTQTPGTTPAYSTDGNTAAFSATEVSNIKNIWSRVAEKYAPFDVNVTTVDPAVAAGQAGSDSQRQTYYDTHSRVMHTVIGGSGGWNGGGGVSYIGVTANGYSGTGNSNGYHTNWVFSAQAPSNLQFVAEASAHENGHGFNLYHQSDYSGNTLINEYSSGTGTGAASKAPIMGNSYSAERGLWKVGTAHVTNTGPTTQRDPFTILSSNTGLAYINDGIGHNLANATPLPMSGLAVDYNLAKGVIVPKILDPNPSGLVNYTSDYWSFSTGNGLISLSVKAGRQTITPGLSDPGAMLDASLEILNTSGTVLYSSATSSLGQSLVVPLTAGNYVARVLSAADPSGSNFYDMGSYFLTGTLLAVPEPSTMALLIAAVTCLAVSRRKWQRRSV